MTAAFEIPFKDRIDSYAAKHISMLYVVTSQSFAALLQFSTRNQKAI